MTLRPEDIERQVFKEGWRGYDQDEVDRFLDRVAESLRALARERDDAAERLHRIETQAAEALQSEQLLKRTLIAAQRSADETVAEAREQAAELVADAERRADERVAEAERRADDLCTKARRDAEEVLSAARHQAQRELARARGEASRIERAVEDLQRLRLEYRDQVRAVIAEHLALLDRAGDVPDLPPQLAHLSGLHPADTNTTDDASSAFDDEHRAGDMLAEWHAADS